MIARTFAPGADGRIWLVGEGGWARGPTTERIYRLTANVPRPSERLLHGGDIDERVDAMTTLLFDATRMVSA